MCTWREIWILPINQQCDVIISEVGNDEYVFCGGNMSGFEVIEGGLTCEDSKFFARKLTWYFIGVYMINNVPFL